MNQQTCNPDLLDAFLQNELSDFDEQQFTRHLDECADCREELESRTAERSAWQEASNMLGGTLQRSTAAIGHNRTETGRSPQIEQVLQQLAPTDDPAMLGRIGSYEVSGVVGAGGMGVVLKAHDRSLDRIVAIKVMAPHLASNGSARKRFAREAKAAAAVLHPNVIAIHGVASDDACPYLVMPYLRGASLQKRIDLQGPLPLKDTLRIGSQIAAGLAAAHEQGLVHRDIKPANILLEDGVERVTITDFGLARAVDDASMTCSGVIAGTPQYMSPEQTRGEPIDARSDLFSLGSVLYAMCTGRSPFRAETTYGVLHRIANDDPTPICEVNSDVPVWLSHIIERLMAKRPDGRFESAAQVAELLEGCLAHVQQPAAIPLPASITTLAPHRIRRLPVGKFIAAASFAFSLIIAGVLIVLEMNKGTLTIECDADDVPIRIMQGNAIVNQLTISKEARSIRIAAGSYVVVVDSATDGIVAREGGNIELTRGETKIVRITYSDERLSRAVSYDVREFIDKEDPRPIGAQLASLADLLLTTIEPESWKATENASIVPSPENLSLFVRQSNACHKAIQQLFDSLRELRQSEEMNPENGINSSLEKIANLPDDTEVHVVGCYTATNDQPVNVRVERTGKPMVVVLNAYSATSWNLDIDKGADVQGVILSGYFDQRFSHIAPKDQPTRILTYFPVWKGISSEEKKVRGNRCFYVWSPLLEDFGKMQSLIRSITERNLTTFQGIYSAESFVIDGLSGAGEAQIGVRWHNLSERSVRESPGYRKMVAQLESVNNDDHSGLNAAQLQKLNQLMDVYETGLSSTDAAAVPGTSGRQPDKKVDFVLDESHFENKDRIEIQSVTTSGVGLEVGATVTVTGAYTLESVDAADLCFYLTTTLEPGEKPKGKPIQPDQRVEVKKGTNTFALSLVVEEIGRPHITFYHQTTGNPIGGVYFSERVEKVPDVEGGETASQSAGRPSENFEWQPDHISLRLYSSQVNSNRDLVAQCSIKVPEGSTIHHVSASGHDDSEDSSPEASSFVPINFPGVFSVIHGNPAMFRVTNIPKHQGKNVFVEFDLADLDPTIAAELKSADGFELEITDDDIAKLDSGDRVFKVFFLSPIRGARIHLAALPDSSFGPGLRVTALAKETETVIAILQLSNELLLKHPAESKADATTVP
jgi:serine/threonine protein kinase